MIVPFLISFEATLERLDEEGSEDMGGFFPLQQSILNYKAIFNMKKLMIAMTSRIPGLMPR